MHSSCVVLGCELAFQWAFSARLKLLQNAHPHTTHRKHGLAGQPSSRERKCASPPALRSRGLAPRKLSEDGSYRQPHSIFKPPQSGRAARGAPAAVLGHASRRAGAGRAWADSESAQEVAQAALLAP